MEGLGAKCIDRWLKGGWVDSLDSAEMDKCARNVENVQKFVSFLQLEMNDDYE